jgi:predicted DNA-binding ribbon-helix-helix protein
MKSTIVKRSVLIGKHHTSVSLEDAVWSDLKNIARSKQETLSELVEKIDRTRDNSNLSSAIRLFVLEHFRSKRQVHPV